MRVGVRRFLSVVAIYALALHSILWGVAAPFAVNAAGDPFSVICHSEAASPAEQPASAPTYACDHCNLCSASAPLAALDAIPAGDLAPARLLQVMRPASLAARSNLATTPNRARGPPSFA